ncbi:HAD family hydrolase [Methanococcoides burtonii]|uniref:Haloacid dehalogenase-like hydrolase family protein n=1 Tax=Methanococcoides burtonii (strain DSM 6242 / NBRC 107633 / OCM 468 / ACE-M) TaxID=259564 RepID=Q12YV5_METBU|nr:HAD family phosphatase [Methanococcoides burtonii]ABE51371.1 Haloacid dehalogenase-like hydrolase family protein [Methanococcoides burtonii DSM 6242]
MFNTLIFDADGVLVNSMPFHADAWIQTFSEVGIDVIRQDIYDIEGSNFVGIIELIFKKAGRDADPELIEKLRVRKRELFFKYEKATAFEGMYDFLNEKKDKYNLAVVSGSDRPIIDKMFNKLYPDIFDLLISGADVAHGKPHPEPYLKAVEYFGVDKEKCLVIENAPLGVESAKNASLYCVAVSTHVNPKGLEKADKVFNNHSELLEFLKQLV